MKDSKFKEEEQKRGREKYYKNLEKEGFKEKVRKRSRLYRKKYPEKVRETNKKHYGKVKNNPSFLRKNRERANNYYYNVIKKKRGMT